MRKTLLGLIALCGAFLVGGMPARAITYDFTIDHCSNGCGTGPYGSITVISPSVGELDFSANMLTNQFVTTGVALKSLSFDLASTVGVAISGLTAGFTWLGTGSYMNDGFGTFNEAIACNGQGGGHPCGSTLAFTLTGAGLTLASLLKSVGGDPSVFFGADIISGTTGNTGPVGALSAVPLPSAVWLFGSALAGLVLLGRRKKNAARPTAA